MSGAGLVSSGRYVGLLWRRAVAMLEGARWRLGRGEYDLACFEAEQAAQLAVKALLYEFTGSAPRIHSLSELLGVLHRFLVEAGLEEAASLVAGFAMKQRRRLWMLEEAYYRGRYGYIEYSRGEAEDCIHAAESLLALLEEVRRRAGAGEAASGEAA